MRQNEPGTMKLFYYSIPNKYGGIEGGFTFDSLLVYVTRPLSIRFKYFKIYHLK